MNSPNVREMQTTLWGAPLWTVIHLVSFNYPTKPTRKQKRDYSRWIALVGRVMPCKEARAKFEMHIWRALPTSKHEHERSKSKVTSLLQMTGVMDNRYKFSHFCYRLHREVNRTLNRDASHTYEEICHAYESYRAGCLTATQKKLNSKIGREDGCTEAKEGRKKLRSSLHLNPVMKADETPHARPPALVVQDACRSNVTFTREDFDSPDGMQTAMWGCLMWTVIHAVSFSIPVSPTAQQKGDYVDWLLATSNVLPCTYCRLNFPGNLCTAAKKLQVHDPDCSWRHILLKYLEGSTKEPLARVCYEIHKAVNVMLKKKETSITSFAKLQQRYDMFRVGKPLKQMSVIVCPRQSKLQPFVVK